MPIKITLLTALMLLCGAVPAQAVLFCGSGLFASAVVVSATTLTFGNYTPASNSFASANIRIRCGALGIDLLPAFTVSLTSLNGTSPAARYLNLSSSHLGYNVYTNTSYSNAAIWGDGTNGSVTQSYSSLLVLGDVTFTAWGKLPTGQYVAAGAYGDLITVTVSY